MFAYIGRRRAGKVHGRFLWSLPPGLTRLRGRSRFGEAKARWFMLPLGTIVRRQFGKAGGRMDCRVKPGNDEIRSTEIADLEMIWGPDRALSVTVRKSGQIRWLPS